MSSLDGILADLVDSDRECSYATVKREPLEALIGEWLGRGDQIALLCALLGRARDELAQAYAGSAGATEPDRLSRESMLRELDSVVTNSAAAIAHHRHAVRLELAARLKQALRASIAEIRSHITNALLEGNRDVAERLESECQTVQILIHAINTMVNCLLTRDLAAWRPSGDSDGPPLA